MIPASAVAAAHGRYGIRGSCRLGDGGKFAVDVTVSVVVMPEWLFAKIFVGLTVHVAFESDGGALQLKFTSSGKVEPDGVVVKVSTTFAGVPGVTWIIPGTDCAIVKSTLVMENAAEDATPATDAVTL
jgi:hypothetical protein